MAFTFKSWATGLVTVSLCQFKMINVSFGHLFLGWTSMGHNRLFSHLRSWVHSIIQTYDLRRLREKRHFYGKWEAALRLCVIFDKAVHPANFKLDLQKALYIQWCLNCGEWPGLALRGGQDRFIWLQDITIRRVVGTTLEHGQHMWAWDVYIDITTWKGDQTLGTTLDLQVAICKHSRVQQNLQFEVAMTLVPFLINRKALAAVTANGTHVPIESVHLFLALKESVFVGTGDAPLFVAMDQGFGGLKLNPDAAGQVALLTTASAAMALGKIFAKAGLGAYGAYAFCYMKGNMIKIIHGKTAQGKALHHCVYGQQADTRYFLYSSGMQNIPISRTMLEDVNPSKRDRLANASFFQRRLGSDAMAATLRSIASEEAGMDTQHIGVTVSKDKVDKAVLEDKQTKACNAAIEAAVCICQNKRDAVTQDPTSADACDALCVADNKVAKLYRQQIILQMNIQSQLKAQAVSMF